MKKALALIWVATSLAMAQLNPDDIDKMSTFVTVYETTSASPTAVALAIVGPAVSAKQIYHDRVVIRCPEACDVTFEVGGTVPTATDITATSMKKRNYRSEPVSKAYSNPNSASPSYSMTYKVSAGIDTPFDCAGLRFPSGSAVAQKVLVVKTTAVTGLSSIKVFHGER